MQEDVIEEHVRCFCHTAQLAVKTALEDTPAIQNLLKTCRDFVRLVKTSNIASGRLRTIQQDQLDLLEEREAPDPEDPHYHSRPLKLVQDVVTRWSSTHMMCQRLALLESPIRQLCEEYKKDDASWSYAFNDLQWKQLKQLCDILQPCADAIKMLEGDKYVTLSFVVPTIVMLRAMLEGKSAEQPQMPDYHGYDEAVNAVRHAILQEMDVPGRFDRFSKPSRFAAALDPRFRGLSFLGNQSNQNVLWNEIYRYCKDNFVPAAPPAAPPPAAPAPPPAGAVPLPGPPVPPPAAAPPAAPPPAAAPIPAPVAPVAPAPVAPAPHAPAAVPPAWQPPARVPGAGLYAPNSLHALLLRSFGAPAPADPLLEEIKAYRALNIGPEAIDDVNPLDWWKQHEPHFPTLAKAARRFLCIPASSAPSERVFSKVNSVVTKRRASLLPEKVEKLVFLKHNA